RQQETQNPNRPTYDPTAQPPLSSPGLHRSHDHHVAVHANARQEQYAGVEVGFLHQTDQLANPVTEQPPTHQRRGVERQHQSQQSVRDHQVEQVNLGRGQGLPYLPDQQVAPTAWQ
ncbi:hypothetical protein AMEX_G14790, partial [Astyanax mexicanus]